MASQDPNQPKTPSGDARAAAVAWTLPFSLVVPMVIGGAGGFFLDKWWHTKPALMIVLGIAGLVIGVRDAVKTMNQLDK